MKNYTAANIILVGTKVDLVSQRCISYDQAKAFAEAHNVSLIEVSAKNSTNVQDAFETVAKEYLLSLPQPAATKAGCIIC